MSQVKHIAHDRSSPGVQAWSWIQDGSPFFSISSRKYAQHITVAECAASEALWAWHPARGRCASRLPTWCCTAKLTAGELLVSASSAFASNPAMSFCAGPTSCLLWSLPSLVVLATRAPHLVHVRLDPEPDATHRFTELLADRRQAVVHARRHHGVHAPHHEPVTLELAPYLRQHLAADTADALL